VIGVDAARGAKPLYFFITVFNGSIRTERRRLSSPVQLQNRGSDPHVTGIRLGIQDIYEEISPCGITFSR
jgi:hypothetical protein